MSESLNTVGDWKKYLAPFKDEQVVKLNTLHMPSVEVVPEAVKQSENVSEEKKAEDAVEAKVD